MSKVLAERPSVDPKHASITWKEAMRGVYIDFEGFKKGPPQLVGERCEWEMRHVFLDKKYRPAAEFKGLDTRSFTTYCNRLVERCRKESRRLIALHDHEMKMIGEYAGINVADIYCDARLVGKEWRRRTNRGKGRNSLANFGNRLGLEYPAHFGKRLVTKRLRHIERALQRHESWDMAPKGAKAAHTKLLQYSTYDVSTLRDLTIFASTVLEHVPAKH